MELVEKGDFADQLSVAAEQGRDLMYVAEADLLVWEWTVEGRNELRFLAMTPLSDGELGAFGLGNALILPLIISGPMESVLHGAVLSAVGPTFKGL